MPPPRHHRSSTWQQGRQDSLALTAHGSSFCVGECAAGAATTGDVTQPRQDKLLAPSGCGWQPASSDEPLTLNSTIYSVFAAPDAH